MFTYTLVISTHSHSGLNNDAPTAQSILDMMEDTQNLPSPNTFTYNTAIDAWACSHHPKAPNKAMAILHHMRFNTHSNPDLHVDRYIDCIAKCIDLK
eukprot:13592992-Ditylum_brightwellii.AAC.1